MLKPAFWNRHCQVLHHDGYRVGSFIMYPFLTEKKKAFAPGEEGGELPSELFSVPPSTSHGFRANIYKVSFAFNLRTWTQSHSQLFPPCSCLPTSQNYISAGYGLDPVEKKQSPTTNVVVCHRPGFSQYRSIHFLDRPRLTAES